jgi:hypothetical protein
MTRVLALALAATIVFGSPAFAQSTPAPARPAAARPAAVTPPPSARADFSARAAGIEKLAAARPQPDTARADAAAQNAQPDPARRSFWKTPWPYVIIAGVVAGVLIAGGDGDGIY